MLRWSLLLSGTNLELDFPIILNTDHCAGIDFMLTSEALFSLNTSKILDDIAMEIGIFQNSPELHFSCIFNQQQI